MKSFCKTSDKVGSDLTSVLSKQSIIKSLILGQYSKISSVIGSAELISPKISTVVIFEPCTVGQKIQKRPGQKKLVKSNISKIFFREIAFLTA